MKPAILTPNVSVGDIKLGDDIENYPTRALEYSDEAGEDPYSCFAFTDTPVQAFVNEAGRIETIRCETECIWQGVNLIGMEFAEFQTLYPEEPDEVDRLLVDTPDGEQDQDVYDYDDLGLQVWSHNGKIVVIMASIYAE
jgi:hypothetical protein